jgi:site-specific recombinase XerC
VRLILTRHVTSAAKKMPSLKTKRIHPHSLRHSTADPWLKSHFTRTRQANYKRITCISCANNP